MTTPPIYLTACGKTGEYFKQHPDVADELVQAVERHIQSHPEIQAQLDRQQERLKELHMWRELHEWMWR